MSVDDEADEAAIRRILIALDASPASMAALEAAAELARRLNAELLGLFVEDINLLRLSELPFARQVGLHSASVSQISREDVEKQLRAQASLVRRALADLALSSNLRSEFRVVRGSITAELLQAALDTDLIILGKAGWSRRQKLGSTARTMIKRSPGHTMFLQHGTRIAHAVGVIYDGSVLAARVLSLAASLLPDIRAGLSILVLAERVELAHQMEPDIEEWLVAHRLTGHIHWVHGPGGKRLANLVRAEQLGILVLPASLQGLTEDDLEEFLNETSTPVLLVRQ
jgi:nucleotide-binding universal stress UspA family protein